MPNSQRCAQRRSSRQHVKLLILLSLICLGAAGPAARDALPTGQSQEHNIAQELPNGLLCLAGIVAIPVSMVVICAIYFGKNASLVVGPSKSTLTIGDPPPVLPPEGTTPAVPRSPRRYKLSPGRIRKGRARAGWTQEDLAKRMGVSRATISRWENGGLAVPPRYRKRLRYALRDFL